VASWLLNFHFFFFWEFVPLRDGESSPESSASILKFSKVISTITLHSKLSGELTFEFSFFIFLKNCSPPRWRAPPSRAPLYIVWNPIRRDLRRFQTRSPAYCCQKKKNSLLSEKEKKMFSNVKCILSLNRQCSRELTFEKYLRRDWRGFHNSLAGVWWNTYTLWQHARCCNTLVCCNKLSHVLLEDHQRGGGNNS